MPFINTVGASSALALEQVAGDSMVRDLKIMLNLTLASTNIDAWSDLLADASGINTGASSGYLLNDGKIIATRLEATNENNVESFGSYYTYKQVGQTFVTPSNFTTLNSIKVRLYREGSPTAGVRMRIYSVNTNGFPGALLFTSSNTPSPTQTTADYTFNFTGATLSANTKYCFVLDYLGSTTADDLYHVKAGDADTYPYGNLITCSSSDVWVAQAKDLYFQINPLYGVATVVWNAVTPTEALTNMAVTADQTVGTGSITWYLSDDGTNWVQITSLDTMQSVNFDVASVRLKCVLTGNAEVRAVAWGGY